jgi:hypothetical protein
MANTKLSAFFSLLLVFCSGAVVGIIGYRFYNTSIVAPTKALDRRQPPSPEEFRKQRIEEMTREVHLDGQQVAKLGEIFDETKARFDDVNTKLREEGKAIRDDQIAKIKALLRPDQVPLYEALDARKEAERENERKKRGRKGPGIVPDKGDKGK